VAPNLYIYLYRGAHPCFIEMELFKRVQAVLRRHNKPKYRKQEFAFRGLLHCAQDHCTITAERKKQKYVYYRCTGYRGKCATPRFTEPEMAEKLGTILKQIQIPDHVLAGLQKSLARDQEQAQTVITAQRNALHPRLSAVRRRIDQAYQDKLDGKIPEEFWERKMTEWTRDERSIQDALTRLEHPTKDRLLTAQRTLELANKAYSLYLKRDPEEQAQLLRMVLLNCAIGGASVQATYRKPFDLIFERARKTSGWSALWIMIWDISIWRRECSNRSKTHLAQKCYLCLRYDLSPMSPGWTNQEWSGREDLNLRPPGPEARAGQNLSASSGVA
jgi:site-specific DNA recombinase